MYSVSSNLLMVKLADASEYEILLFFGISLFSQNKAVMCS